MESASETRYIQRKFGHCVVNWKIENYGFAAHGMEYEIKSPLFSVRPHMTAWTLALKSKLGLCEDTEIVFCLERMTDAGPDTVWVHMDISLFDQDGKEWNTSREKYHIARNDSKVICVPNIYFGRVNVNLYDFNSMTVRCQMIVHEERSNVLRDVDVDYGIKHLAIDMAYLYRREWYNDVTLKFDNDSKQKVAHRAVLSARSEVLKDVFSRDAGKEFSYPSLHFDEARQVLNYLYTGEVSNILEEPSFSTADCIKAFSLKELEDLYTADEQQLNSKIDVHQTGVTWSIENFSKSDEYMLSRKISSDFVGMSWELRLYPRGIEGKDDYLTIIAENMDGKIDGDMWAKVEVHHDSNDRSWKTMQVVKEGELFELLDFESRKSVFEKLENDILKICFEACVSTGETHSSNTQQVYPVKRFPRDYYYKNLSKDLSSLREDTKFTDIAMKAEGKEFKAHKFILDVRSNKLHDLLRNRNEDKVTCIENIRSDILEIVLDYVYSGVVKTLDFDTLLKVYEAAWKMDVPSLIIECSKLLLKNLSENNVCSILVSPYGQRDTCLKDGIFQFLFLNLDIYFKVLERLYSTNQLLTTEVRRAVEAASFRAFSDDRDFRDFRFI